MMLSTRKKAIKLQEKREKVGDCRGNQLKMKQAKMWCDSGPRWKSPLDQTRGTPSRV